MNTSELVKRFKNHEVSHEEIVMWCRENIKDIDLNDGNQTILYYVAVKYLMDDKLGKWDREDASFIIMYFSTLVVRRTTVSVLGKDEYERIYGDDSNAICVTKKDGTFKIDYSSKVVDNLLSNDYGRFLRGMQTIFHEPMHVLQEIAIRFPISEKGHIPSKTTYIIALETLARKINPKSYNENYEYLFKENQAEKFGLQHAINKIKQYSPKLFRVYNEILGEEAIAQRLKVYDRTFFDKMITIQTGREVEFLKWVQALASKYIEMHPEILMEYPGLQVGYNLDGTQKDLSQLISERDDVLASGDIPVEKIDELYDVIINHSVVLGANLPGDIAFLEDYIARTGTEDKFIFSVLEARLSKYDRIIPEQISIFMQEQYDIAAKVREKRKMQEIKSEEPEDAVWENRFQSWENEAANLPNIAKEQAGIVEAIQEVSQEEHSEKTDDNRGAGDERKI